MPLKIIRNDIIKMHTDAIVNTANAYPIVGAGCDRAVYQAAGYEQLLNYRKEHIGVVEEGEVFMTPGFSLPAKYIIHAVSPLFRDGSQGEEEKLRCCYRKSLQLAWEKEFESVAFPLIATGSFGYPREEGMRIAVDEINAFLLQNDMLVYLVVFDDRSTQLGEQLCSNLESYIDQNYVYEKRQEEYEERDVFSISTAQRISAPVPRRVQGIKLFTRRRKAESEQVEEVCRSNVPVDLCKAAAPDFSERHESALEERMEHLSDTFSQYLLYLISTKGMTNAEVYKRAIVDKKTFSKIKNNPKAHPQKMTAMCLCVGARLNLDETRDLLARAGYALSPCDKTDVIFSYFIENEIYDMIELDIQLEEHGLPCLIS